MTVNIPAWVYLQDGAPGKTSTVVIDLEYIQQNVVNEGSNQPANQAYPYDPTGNPVNKTTTTCDLPLGEIDVFMDGWHFRPEQASSMLLWITPPGGARTSYALYAHDNVFSMVFKPTKAQCPTPGTYIFQVEIDFQGTTYLSNLATVILTQAPLQ